MKIQRRGAKTQRAQSFFVNIANMRFYNKYSEMIDRLNIKYFLCVSAPLHFFV